MNIKKIIYVIMLSKNISLTILLRITGRYYIITMKKILVRSRRKNFCQSWAMLAELVRNKDFSLNTFWRRLKTFLQRCIECRAVESRERCLSVRLSVSPSVKRVNCGKTVEKSMQIFYRFTIHAFDRRTDRQTDGQIFIPHERTFTCSIVFWEK